MGVDQITQKAIKGTPYLIPQLRVIKDGVPLIGILELNE